MSKIRLQEKQYVLSVSFANYLKGVSGMAKVLMEHQMMYNNQGIGYVNLFVVKKYLFKEKVTAFCFYGLVIDGEYKGIYTIEQIINFLFAWSKQNKMLLDIHFHHFLYIKMNQIHILLEHISDVPIKVYLHDYYTVCWNYTLLKNGKLYCGPYGLETEKCTSCKFYERSQKRIREIKKFLSLYKTRITVISPSEAAKKIWLKTYPEFENQIEVLEHQKQQGEYQGNRDEIDINHKIKVAFLGMPAEHKGWKIWEELVAQFKDKGYEFVVFNSSDDEYQKITKVKVQYSQKELDAMTNALRKEKIHIVILWAKWPETYSYTLYESMAANLYVITNQESGNITEQVIKRGNGMVLENQTELFELFGNMESVREAVNLFRKNGQCGPLKLVKNDDIVGITLSNAKTMGFDIQKCKNRKIYMYPILWVLWVLYKFDKIPG